MAFKCFSNEHSINKQTLHLTRICFVINLILALNPITSFIKKDGLPYTKLNYICYVCEVFLLTLLIFGIIPFKRWILHMNSKDIVPEGKDMCMICLRDPIARLYLSKHMKELLQEEKYFFIIFSIIFWIAISELRETEEISKDDMNNCVKHIYNRFITENGDLEINIPDKMKKKISRQIRNKV